MRKELKFLEKFYASVVHDKALLKSYLQKNELAPLSIDVQEKILDITIRNPVVLKYPPPITFQIFFLRTILDIKCCNQFLATRDEMDSAFARYWISRSPLHVRYGYLVESSGCELCDNLVEVYAKLLSQSTNAGNIYRTYIINDDYKITLQESSCFVTNSTTGLQTWEASKYLLEWCLENTSVFQAKRILELGSGIGLLGIAVIKLCQPQKYLFSDKSWDVLNLLTKNIGINFEESVIKQVIEKHQISWGALSPEDVLELAADVLLGADIIFDPSTIESLVKTLKLFLDHGRTKNVYIASTIRNTDTNACFLAHLDSAKLNHEVLDVPQKCIFIYNQASNFILYRIFSKVK